MPKVECGCRNCGLLEIDKELAQGQHLCTRCLKSLPRISCHFCAVYFQQLPESKRNSKVHPEACVVCEHQYLKHGEPSVCDVCGNTAAFSSKHCKLCASHMIKYGNPVPCSKCQVVRAFDRPDKRARHQGSIYCFSCIRAHKTMPFSSTLHKEPAPISSSAPPDTHRPSNSKEPSFVKDSEKKLPTVFNSDHHSMKRTRGDAFSPQESNPEVASFQARELEISVLRRRVQEADERAAKLEARCKQLEFESQESKMKHVASLKELDSYVCAHNMEKYQGKAREMEWKNKFSILQAEHYRLKSDFANLEVAVEMKVQHEVSSWRSRVAQLENELRDVSRELKQIRK